MSPQFQWSPCPDGQLLLDEIIEEVMGMHPQLKDLRQRMLRKTGTRFFDWINHLTVPKEQGFEQRLKTAGFFLHSQAVYSHPGAIFPSVIIHSDNWEICLKVESLEDFIEKHGSKTRPTTSGQVRTCQISSSNGAYLTAIESYGSRSLIAQPSERFAEEYQIALQVFRNRPRNTQDFTQLTELAQQAVDRLGTGGAAAAFFQAEREFWMSRNAAARAQYSRQQSLGLGWANHDHHTYRCRREDFSRMITVFEILGCYCRERFYAGKEARWGAQVMENPEAGIVIFADVDMTPDEVLGDFSHIPLPDRHELGTVGLWCELHGNSLFESGMHHLECQFDFEALALGLKIDADIDVIPAFSNLPHLKQQFTQGERWEITPARIHLLLKTSRITIQQAEIFRLKGAIGSHLENLERNDGFKGFNQSGINEIIQATDPRKA